MHQPSAPALSGNYPSAPALRPLGISEIIDAAIKIYRNNIATLFTLAAIVIVPVQVLAGFVLASVPSNVTRIGTTTPGQPPNVDLSGIWTLVAASFIVGAIGLVASQLATAASLRVISEAYLGESPDWRESLQFALRRLGPLIGVSLLSGLLAGFAFLACILPGVYLAIAWSVSVPVMLFEGTGVWDSMRRSRELVRGHWGSVFGVLFLSQLIAGVLRFILSFAFGIVLSPTTGGITTFIRSVIVGSISGVLITPFLAAAIAIMYFDLRVRKEGFDLELMAQRVGRPDLVPPTGGPVSPDALRREPPARPAPRRTAPRRPGFVPDDDGPGGPATGPDEPIARKRPAPRRPAASRPVDEPDTADDEPDEPPPARKPPARKPPARKPPVRKPPPTDDVPDHPEFGHS